MGKKALTAPLPWPKGVVKGQPSCLGQERGPYLLISSAPMWKSRSVDVKPKTRPFIERLQGSGTNCTR